MIIKPHWNILTIGDGDLSFSRALLQYVQPQQLTASVYDSEVVLAEKYGDEHAWALQQAGTQVIFDLDITRPDSWPQDSTVLPRYHFDVVIFQFPLMPAFNGHTDFLNRCDGLSVNTLNRRLLRLYLIHCQRYLLAEQGAQLCYITSKDLMPYNQWNIEHAINQQTELHYLGCMDFDADMFPGYRIRNVDRDKFVRNRGGTTFVWSPEPDAFARVTTDDGFELRQPGYVSCEQHHYCTPCQAGPFATQQHIDGHLNSRKHRLMMEYEAQWQTLLEREGESTRG